MCEMQNVNVNANGLLVLALTLLLPSLSSSPNSVFALAWYSPPFISDGAPTFSMAKSGPNSPSTGLFSLTDYPPAKLLSRGWYIRGGKALVSSSSVN